MFPNPLPRHNRIHLAIPIEVQIRLAPQIDEAGEAVLGEIGRQLKGVGFARAFHRVAVWHGGTHQRVAAHVLVFAIVRVLGGVVEWLVFGVEGPVV
jgi:hypothetical protein